MSALPSVREYPIASLSTHQRLQVRGGTNEATVSAYASAMRQGAQFPPIEIAQIGLKLYVVDGHHRLAAAAAAGLVSLPGSERRMSLDEAHLVALSRNREHGRQMTQAEKSAAFRSYLDAGLYLDEFKATKSLSMIAADCPFYSRGHIGKLMRHYGIRTSDVEGPAHKWSNLEPTEEDLAEEGAILWTTFQRHLDDTAAAIGPMSAEARERAIRKLRELADALSPASPPAPGFVPLDI